VAVNPVTNKIYVANMFSANVTVIDGTTNDTTLVPAGTEPCAVAVNPTTNKIYVANNGSDNVTVIDATTNDTTLVHAGTGPCAVAVNLVTNKVYVPNQGSDNVTVIDGATNDTTTVPAGTEPCAAAVNPVTNRVYVANYGSANVTVIDGVTNNTTLVPADSAPCAVAVNPVTNNIYVANLHGDNVTVIDGATNSTTIVAAGTTPLGIAVNPVTNRVYVANNGSDNVTVLTDVPTYDTKVRAAFDRLPGDTTSFGRPTLTGKGVNRSTPNQTAMIGVCNRLNTAQTAWDWATVLSGAGTDSITWTYNWGTDSLIAGENFVCCVPLEDQAATTNNLGLGSPFAGNLEVYPVYRIGFAAGVEESPRPQATSFKLGPTIIRGVLFLGDCPRTGTVPKTVLLDISGRKVLDLKPGPNDVSALAPGVYFVRNEGRGAGDVGRMRKVVVQR
jgi:YVTN family beta-propeller protein